MVDLYLLNNNNNSSNSSSDDYHDNDYHGYASRAREKITNWISFELSRYSQTIGVDIQPINVRKRLSTDELKEYYLHNVVTTNIIEVPVENLKSEDDTIVDDDQFSHDMIESSASSDERLKTDKSRVNGRPVHQKEMHHHTDDSKAKPATVAQPEPQSINISRLKLKAALNRLRTTDFLQTSDSATDTKAELNAESRLCDENLELKELTTEEIQPNYLEKEPYLRVLGLCTHAHKEFLLARRMERKRRQCTSTARTDYHYGRFDLFEKQYAHAGKRQFLYSPPATRARKRRPTVQASQQRTDTTNIPDVVVVIREKGDRSVHVDIAERVCITCFKRSMHRKILTNYFVTFVS